MMQNSSLMLNANEFKPEYFIQKEIHLKNLRKHKLDLQKNTLAKSQELQNDFKQKCFTKLQIEQEKLQGISRSKSRKL